MISTSLARLLRDAGLRARRERSQNFLADESHLKKIAALALMAAGAARVLSPVHLPKLVAEPRTQPGYWLDFNDSVLTLNFTLPVKAPMKAKELKVEVYDPTIFVDFAWAKKDPVSMVGGKGCKADVMMPREMTMAESKALSAPSS